MSLGDKLIASLTDLARTLERGEALGCHYKITKRRLVKLCKCEDGPNDPDKTGMCMDCHRPWDLAQDEVEDTSE